MIFQRILEKHPELANVCAPVKFHDTGRGSNQETPATDVEGLNSIIMRMGGRAAKEFRATGKVCKRKRPDVSKDDLYVMKYSTDNNAVKIGRSENVEKRRRSLETGQNFFVEVVAIFPGKGYLEPDVHDRLQHYQSKSGAGVEWFNIRAADAALVCSNTLKEIEQACASKANGAFKRV